MWSILRFGLIFFGMRFMTQGFHRPSKEQKEVGQTARTDIVAGQTINPLAGQNLWSTGQPMDLYVYLSEDENFSNFKDTSSLIWHEKGLTYDCENWNERSKDEMIHPPLTVKRNESDLWGHVYMVKRGHDIDPSSKKYASTAVIYRKRKMNKHLKSEPKKEVKSLLGGTKVTVTQAFGDAQATDGTDNGGQIVSNYWKPTLYINLVHDFTIIQPHKSPFPELVMDEIEYDENSGRYFPVIYFNDFLLMNEQLVPLNETSDDLSLKMHYQCMTMFRWTLQVQMTASWSQQQENGFSSAKDMDELKRMISDTHPWLLGTTAVVTVLHTVFDCLAFKNDIQFWRKAKSMEGLSVRSLFMTLFFQVVVFLYLMDNETSYMILFSRGLGLFIEAWKLTKALDFARSDSFPWIQFSSKDSYIRSNTKKFDDIAMGHLFYIVYPGVLGYAAYALIYNEYKSWYSWFISSLVGFIYMFGFVMMTPQLFINYKLKSVAHLPWRAMVYKSLNTFIDDLFAFVIKMPLMHRLSCFRDDIIFFIFLYQRWIYRVDMSRRNEFGVTGDDFDEYQKQKLQTQASQTVAKSVTATPANLNSATIGEETPTPSTDISDVD